VKVPGPVNVAIFVLAQQGAVDKVFPVPETEAHKKVAPSTLLVES